MQARIEEALVRIGGPAASQTAGDQEDIDRFQEIVGEVAFDSDEADLLQSWLVARAERLLEHPTAQRLAAHLLQRLEDAGGTIDLQWQAQRDTAPLIEVPVTINMPPERPPRAMRVIRDGNGDALGYEETNAININVSPTPVTIENTLQAPDKVITFARDGAGQIVEAESTSAPTPPVAA